MKGGGVEDNVFVIQSGLLSSVEYAMPRGSVGRGGCADVDDDKSSKMKDVHIFVCSLLFHA